jgi:sugar O-acyltransferase (sialic acid O-acetyltransferase NeuD family)
VKKSLAIFGAGQHGKVVLACARSLAFYSACLFLDDRAELEGKMVDGIEVVGGRGVLKSSKIPRNVVFMIGLGDIEKRVEIASIISQAGYPFATIVHPRAIVGENAIIGEGTLVEAGCLVAHGAKIGRHVILNPGSSVNHDNVIGDFAHIAGGVVLGGGVSIGDRTLLGVGAVIGSHVKIGSNVSLSAGALVVRDVPDDSVVVARPSRVMRGER